MAHPLPPFKKIAYVTMVHNVLINAHCERFSFLFDFSFMSNIFFNLNELASVTNIINSSMNAQTRDHRTYLDI